MTTGAGGAAPPREVRIGLVLYGGVSLAIYIYGVCQEILRLCRASAALDAARSAGRRAESLSSSGAPGAYAQALRRLDARAVVDIIAGTSAGGINGVALAKALALDQGLEGLRRVWVDQGDLEFLLHSPGDKGAESLIDADRHEAMVKNALDGMEAAGSRRPPQPPAVPSVPLPGLAPVLDLFVTAINLYGKLLDHRDFLGSHIQTKDYRKVFHRKLRMREYRQNDFTAEHNATLAKRCRATSSFPVAIAPLVATPGELNTVPWEDGEDVTLCLADGGILDNKPFTSMLRIIFTRSAQGRVDRVVLYVEPDPEPVGTPASKPRSKPDFLTVAGLAASGIPRYESIDQDLRAVQEHNRRVERLQGSLRKAAPAEDETVANPNQFWGQLRKQHTWQVYHHLKLDDLKRQLGDTFAAGVGKEQTHLHRAFLDELDARTSTDEAQGTFLSVFDLQYQARRAYHVIETLAPLYSPLHANGLSKEVAQLGLLERDLWNVLEAARYAQWSAWELGSEAWPAEFRRGLLALHDLKAGSVADVRPAVTSHLDAVRTYLASVRRHLNGTLDGAFPEANMPTVQRGGHTVGEALDELFAPLRGGGSELSALLPASFTDIWDRYELRDIILHPVAAVSDLGERDRIEVVRISPDAAHFIDRDAKSKLAGDAVVHFGGFLKREWRQNDILWGRLDASEILVKTLAENYRAQGGQRLPTAELDALIHAVHLEVLGEEREALRQESQVNEFRTFPTILDGLEADGDYRRSLGRGGAYRVGEGGMREVGWHYLLRVAARSTGVLKRMAANVKAQPPPPTVPRTVAAWMLPPLTLGHAALRLISWRGPRLRKGGP